MDLRNKSRFTREERLKIVKDYETNRLTAKETCKIYGLKDPSIIATWRKRLQKPPVYLRKSEKSSTFAPEIKPQMADEMPMKKLTPEELAAENKRLTKELEWAKLQNKALNTLIDIAESQGIRIRKKSGAKQ
jgi:transposase-like protein